MECKEEETTKHTKKHEKKEEEIEDGSLEYTAV
mgnify:CR=1 FL=1